MHYVYILKSLQHKRIYIGISQNPEQRLAEHNAGQTKSTKFYRPYQIIYQETFKTRTEARQREKILKSGYCRENIKKFLDP